MNIMAFAYVQISGSGGIWRIATINEAGGWNDRTTVEDMDLAVRAGLLGWKFVYTGNIEVRFLIFMNAVQIICEPLHDAF